MRLIAREDWDKTERRIETNRKRSWVDRPSSYYIFIHTFLKMACLQRRLADNAAAQLEFHLSDLYV